MISLAERCHLGRNRSCMFSAGGRGRRSWRFNMRGLTRTGLTKECLQGKYLFGREVMCAGTRAFPLKAGMPQEFSQCAVLKLEVGLRQVRTQTATPTAPLHSVACGASLNAVLETPFACEELAS